MNGARQDIGETPPFGGSGSRYAARTMPTSLAIDRSPLRGVSRGGRIESAGELRVRSN